jgi:hypothetical protein
MENEPILKSNQINIAPLNGSTWLTSQQNYDQFIKLSLKNKIASPLPIFDICKKTIAKQQTNADEE